MDENCPVFPEANVENRDGKCKRRQSGILKISRSPLRTLKEADVSQKIEQVGKLRRSSRRVSFAETKEVKEFVTDKMMIIQDVENGIDSQKENQLNELERDMMSLTTNFSIAGMDALLHAPLRTPLQQFEPCDHIETVSKHQIFPDSGIQMRREDAVESSGTKVTSRLPKQIDFKSFLTRFDSPEPTYSNVCFDTGEERANKSFGSIRQNEVPKLQKTIDFKTFLNSTKQSDTDENIMVSMSSIFEEPAMKQTDFGVTSTCNAVEDIEITNDTLLQINSNKNLDPNRTLLFLDQDNDMEFTSSHTIAINHFAMGNSTTTHSSTVPKNVERLGTEGPFPFLKDKTIVFSGEEYMDMTRSDTVPIDVRQVEHLTNQNRLTAVTNQKTDRSILPSIPNEHKIFSDNGYCGKMNQSVTLGTSKLTSSSVSILSSFPSDEAITFSEANGVDIKKGQGITIDNGSLRQGRNEAKVSNKMTRLSNARPVLSSFPCDETMMFSEANDVNITKSHTITIDSESFGKVTNEALGSTGIIPRLTEVDCSLLSFPRDKTIMFSEANDMDITKRHTVTIDSGNLGEVTNKILASMKLATRRSTVGSILSSFPTDKTMVISESNDMDFTKSHTVAIDGGKLGLIVNEISSSTRMTPRLTAAGCPPLSLPSDKTMVFSAANDMDITKGHTVPIDSVNPVQVKNQIMGFTSMPHKLDVPGSIRSFHRDKTIKLSEANDMDITKSHTVTIESKNLGHVTNETYTSTKQASFGNNVGCIPSPFPIDKTMVFSEANDMDQSKSHISSIDRGNLNSVVNWTVGSRMPFPSGKTTVFSEADDLDITKRHTVAMESGNLGSVANHSMDLDKKASIVNTACSVPSSVPNDKTLLFTKANDMDITKSHTVPIESGNLKSATNHNAGLNKMTSRQSIFRSIQPSFPSDNTMVFSEANYMDMTRSHTVAIESGNLGLGTNKMNGSMKLTSIGSTAGLVLSSFPSDETRAFSEANDRDITKSRTVTIESKSVGQVTNEALDFTRMTSKLNVPRSILSSFHSDSTMMLSEANEMDITKSHTVAIDSGNLGQVTNETFSLMKLASTKNTVGSIMSSFPSEKTMVFSESNDMDITKSHVIAIESENLRLVKNHTMGSSKKVSIENTAGSVLSSFPSDKTMVFSEANDMDIIKSSPVAIESGNVRPDANHTMDLSKIITRRSTARSTLSSFPSDKTVVFSEANNMDIAKSHTFPTDSKSFGKVTNEALGSTGIIRRLTGADCSLLSFPSDKTMVFSEANGMDKPKSHTVAIVSGNGRPDANHTMDSSKMNSRRNTARSTLSSFPGYKTVVFSGANDMDRTKSHTVPIDSESLGKVINEAFSSSGMVPRETTAGGSLLSFPRDKTMVFSEANDMDITKSRTVAIESGNDRADANHTMDSSKMTSRRNTARSTLSSFPGYKTAVFSGANEMDGTKSHTVAIESGSLESTTNESLASDKVASRFNAPGSVLSFLPNGKIQVSEPVTAVTKIDTVPIHNKHDVSSNYKILQLVLEKGKNCFVNHSDNVEFASIQNTVENTICNVNCVVHTRRPDSFTGHAESTILNMGTGTEQEGEPVRSTCVTEVHEKLNGKGIKKYVLCTTNSLDSNLMCNNDNAQETRSVDDQNPEAAPEEFVRHKVSDAQSEGTVNSAIAESISTASKSLGHNQSRKSCLANMPSLQKLNSITNVTYGIPVGESGHANWKTLGTKTQFSKQHSLVRDMSKYKISLGIFPPKLPNRENLYEAINSNQQDATKTSEEDLCSSLFQNVTYTSNKLQGDSNIFKPNVGPEINSVIQIESQIADHDQVENTIFDKTEPSHCLKSSDVPCLLIPEQFRKEASPKSHENVTGPDQFLGGSIMIKSVDQRLYQKRAWTEEEENENVGSKRKMRNLGPKDIDSSRQKATGACVVQWEGLEHKIMEENLLGMMTKSLNSTSSLNSTKGDGTSAIAITPKCNLNTSLVIIEESELHEKLMDGQITVREFFKLLKVQTHAQKSRQSELQVNVELDKSSAFENWLAVKFIHRPKREVYEEDSSALSAAIAE
ncbi:hypothetical protein scyTo_0010799 [Scyliorhinus torazame]|uniref:Knl1 C-terminal RWD domain-containing protein n=1 Tax=Scyliorhinus torazame TaxID=75743 RepID=A0A401PBP9_SCYTO|nr:hypothetical protein [Scyliorhinus torazame]